MIEFIDWVVNGTLTVLQLLAIVGVINALSMYIKYATEQVMEDATKYQILRARLTNRNRKEFDALMSMTLANEELREEERRKAP